MQEYFLLSSPQLHTARCDKTEALHDGEGRGADDQGDENGERDTDARKDEGR